MIIPWSCHVCSVKFDKYHGGVCAKCKKSTCLKHLKVVGYTTDQGPAQSEQIACVECIKPGETTVDLRKSLFSQNAWFRRLGF
jgi:hypothetical protein